MCAHRSYYLNFVGIFHIIEVVYFEVSHIMCLLKVIQVVSMVETTPLSIDKPTREKRTMLDNKSKTQINCMYVITQAHHIFVMTRIYKI